MKTYDKTGRNFQATDNDRISDKDDKQKLRPVQYPVNEPNRNNDKVKNDKVE